MASATTGFFWLSHNHFATDFIMSTWRNKHYGNSFGPLFIQNEAKRKKTEAADAILSKSAIFKF
jgi:hypothetical protein